MNIGILTVFEKKNENNSACLKSLTEAVEKKGIQLTFLTEHPGKRLDCPITNM